LIRAALSAQFSQIGNAPVEDKSAEFRDDHRQPYRQSIRPYPDEALLREIAPVQTSQIPPLQEAGKGRLLNGLNSRDGGRSLGILAGRIRGPLS
jgi:hypothetical protein